MNDFIAKTAERTAQKREEANHAYLQPRLDDIDRWLGPKLRLLGLAPKITLNSGAWFIHFKSPDDCHASAVYLSLPSQRFSMLNEAEWPLITVHVENFQDTELGGGRYHHLEFFNSRRFHVKGLDEGSLVAYLNEMLGEHPILADENHDKTCIVSDELAEAFELMDHSMQSRDIERVQVEADRSPDGEERLFFAGRDGTNVAITYDSGHRRFVMRIDAVIVGEPESASMIVDLLVERERERRMR